MIKLAHNLQDLKDYCDNEAGNNNECRDMYNDLFLLVEAVEQFRANPAGADNCLTQSLVEPT